MDSYNGVTIHKEECLAHVLNDSRRRLQSFEHQNKFTYIQCKPTEPKAEYFSPYYSTVVGQNRGQSVDLIAKGLNFSLSHVSVYANCPEDSWCRWRQTSTSAGKHLHQQVFVHHMLKCLLLAENAIDCLLY